MKARSRKNKPVEAEQEVIEGELILAPRVYVLRAPIVYGGVLKVTGEQVELHDHQAERLMRSGHI